MNGLVDMKRRKVIKQDKMVVDSNTNYLKKESLIQGMRKITKVCE